MVAQAVVGLVALGMILQQIGDLRSEVTKLRQEVVEQGKVVAVLDERTKNMARWFEPIGK